MSLRRFAQSFALFLISSPIAGAMSLSGDATTTFLVTDRPTTTDELVTRMPLYQSVNLLIGSMAGGRLSFEGSLRGWRDLKGKASDEGDVRLYRALVRWNDRASGLEARVGRQFVSEGVGRTYLDGVLAKRRFGKLALSGFVGQPLRRDLDGAERWDKTAYQWGAQADWRTSAKLRLSASYTEMRYDGDTGIRLVGGNAQLRFGDSQRVRVRADIDAANGTVDRLLASWAIQPSSGALYSVEGYYRQARLWAFSRLSDITSGHFVRVTATAVRPIKSDFRLHAALSGLNAGGRPGGTADLGLVWRTLRVGYLFASTGSVFGNGLYVQGAYRVNSYVLIGGRTNWSRYEIDEADAATQTIGSAVFATLTPTRGLDITGEAHQITDDRYAYQLEGVLSLRYRFERVSGK